MGYFYPVKIDKVLTGDVYEYYEVWFDTGLTFCSFRDLGFDLDKQKRLAEEITILMNKEWKVK